MENTIVSLALFAFASSITPGPNNLMLMNSGANFGVVRTLPHWIGVVTGFLALLLLAGIGVGAVILARPEIESAFRALCAAVIVWLGWKIARTRPAEETGSARKPLTFLQAFAFQAINPKAWIMALTANSLFAAGGALGDVQVVMVVFGAVNLPCTGLWLLSGELIQRLLRKDTHFRVFNVVMALLLIGSSLPMLL